MDWKQYWDQIGNENTNLAHQVQRNHEEETLITARHLKKTLDINTNDTILDVCCGNGLLTTLVALDCNKIIGIDQSEKLIAVANAKFKTDNCNFIAGSALEIHSLLDEKFNKIYLEFSFQYFDKKNEGLSVVQSMLEVLKPDGLLFIGDIPEKGKEGKLYDTLKKKLYNYSAKIKGKDSMGKFWSPEEISSICDKLNVQGQKINQPDNLPYSHYRFDYLIKK